MIEPNYNVELRGFSDQVIDPVDALMRGFGVSAARAESIVKKLPTIVKRRAKHAEALRYAKALRKLGGEVVVVDDLRGEQVTLEELASIDPNRPGVIASADPKAKGRQLPRAAFRSGSHPALSYPRMTPAVAVSQTSLTALSNDQTDQVIQSSDGSTRKTPLERPPASQRPLVNLEQDIQAAASASAWGDVTADSGGAGHGLELDETAIRAGRDGSTVPKMPHVLGQIRDFETTGWEPLRPGVGLGVAGATIGSPLPSPDQGFDNGEMAATVPSGTVSAVAPAPSSKHDRPRAHTSATGRSAGRSAGPPTLTIVVGVIVATGVVALIFFGARFLGGVSGALEERLRTEAQRELPGFTVEGVQGSSLGSYEMEEEAVEVRLGACYGWIAHTDEQGCDLDLYLYRDGQPVAADVEYNNTPVIFHCPDSDGQVSLRTSNAGSTTCSFGLASLEAAGSVGWPLEPYLGLYANQLSVSGAGGPYTAVDIIRHGTLGPGGRERSELFIPAGSCYNVLAVVQQGLDLDALLYVDGAIVDRDELVDNYPLVGYCAEDHDVWAEVELVMYQGAGPYVWQIFEGRPLGF